MPAKIISCKPTPDEYIDLAFSFEDDHAMYAVSRTCELPRLPILELQDILVTYEEIFSDVMKELVPEQNRMLKGEVLEQIDLNMLYLDQMIREHFAVFHNFFPHIFVQNRNFYSWHLSMPAFYARYEEFRTSYDEYFYDMLSAIRDHFRAWWLQPVLYGYLLRGELRFAGLSLFDVHIFLRSLGLSFESMEQPFHPFSENKGFFQEISAKLEERLRDLVLRGYDPLMKLTSIAENGESRTYDFSYQAFLNMCILLLSKTQAAHTLLQ